MALLGGWSASKSGAVQAALPKVTNERRVGSQKEKRNTSPQTAAKVVMNSHLFND